MRKKADIIFAMVVFLLLVIFKNLIINFAPVIAIVLWFIVSLMNVIGDRKAGRNVSTGHRVSMVLSSAVLVLMILFWVYVLFIMENPFAR